MLRVIIPGDVSPAGVEVGELVGQRCGIADVPKDQEPCPPDHRRCDGGEAQVRCGQSAEQRSGRTYSASGHYKLADSRRRRCSPLRCHHAPAVQSHLQPLAPEGSRHRHSTTGGSADSQTTSARPRSTDVVGRCEHVNGCRYVIVPIRSSPPAAGRWGMEDLPVATRPSRRTRRTAPARRPPAR